MSVSLDLNFLPMVRQNGQDQPEWPGLYVATPPRGAARGRDADLLAVYLTVVGTAPLPADQLKQLLPRLAQVYYRTHGTVTAALKAVVDELNQYLLERNLRASNTGRQGVGLLTQAVLRGDMLFLAHSGPVQTYLIKPEATTVMVDEVGGGRGLGVSRTAAVRFFHTELQPGDHMLFSHRPAVDWNVDTVRCQPNQGIDGLRRGLLGRAGPDLSAVLVQVLGGSGKLRLLRLKAPPPDMAHPTAPAGPLPTAGNAASSETPQPPLAGEMDLPNGWSTLPEAAATASAPAEAQPPPASASLQDLNLEPSAEDAVAGAATTAGVADVANAAGVLPGPVLAAAAPMQAPAAPVRASAVPARALRVPPRPKQDPRQALRPILRGLEFVSQVIGRAMGNFLGALSTVMKRILPDETLLNISPTMMIFLAVLVPVAISILGGLMYLQRGQTMQHEDYVQKARVAIERAEAAESPDEQRANWRLALQMLDDAEFYKTSTQSQALRKLAQGTLDGLDGAERLAFQPALLPGLGETIQITRMAAQAGELYMLDAPSGMILRAIWVGGAFELDRSFTCGPVSDPVPVGPLIDLVALPRGNDQGAAIAAMDANGSLLYCIPGEMPEVVQLAPPPMNFQTPKSLALSAGDLYVLDPGNNGVWIYRNMDFSQQPHLFFENQVPYMQDVVDLAVNNDDLYLLHSDGRQTMCYLSSYEASPTRCDDPANYIDARPGRESGPIIPDSLFDQIYFAPPPDPSLYLLDPANQAVFHFSLRLNFQRQYRSSTALPAGPVSAFTFSPDRLLFLAIKNQVFFAALP